MCNSCRRSVYEKKKNADFIICLSAANKVQNEAVAEEADSEDDSAEDEKVIQHFNVLFMMRRKN